MNDDQALGGLEHEDRLRDEVSARVQRRLARVLKLLNLAVGREGISKRLEELKSLLETGVALIGGQALEGEGEFQRALDEWVERESAGGMRVVWRRVGPWPSWSDRERFDALRILREACENARRHGGASEVWILVQGWNGGYSITVQDNGRGFPVGADRTCGAGMGIMRLRARRCGAQFFAFNREGQGAIVGWSVGQGEQEFSPQALTPWGEFVEPGDDRELAKGLGMELHDDLCQRLVGVLLEMELLRDDLPDRESKLWLQLKDAEEQLRSAYESIRRWSHELIETGTLEDE